MADIRELDEELATVDENLPPENRDYSQSFDRLEYLGFLYTGLNVYGGWGSHVFYEFIHAIFGTLVFDTDRVDRNSEDWIQREIDAPYEDFDREWYMMLVGNDLGAVRHGTGIAELEETMSEIVSA